MSRNPDRLIDKTYLSLETAEERGLIHRDYIAHCFRWTHVVKWLSQHQKYKNAVILDVGCGKEMPLARTLYVNKMTPKRYIGVDVNRFEVPEMLQKDRLNDVILIASKTDICDMLPDDVRQPDGSLPNIMVSFEVLEHVPPDKARAIMEKAMLLTSADAHFFISTPCWNGEAALNHINEITFEALGAMFEDIGFKIVGLYGTFASIKDYKDKLSAWKYYFNDDGDVKARAVDLRPLFEYLSKYYDTNVLATFFAPLFPEAARNCLWHLVKAPNDELPKFHRLFKPFEELSGPWSQHKDWIRLSTLAPEMILK